MTRILALLALALALLDAQIWAVRAEQALLADNPDAAMWLGVTP